MGSVSCAEMESDIKIITILIQIAHVKKQFSQFVEKL